MMKAVQARVRGSRRRVGFSLIETLVSIALVVLLAGVVLPSVLGLLSEQPVERARQAFAAAADTARAEAQRSGKMVVVSCRVGAEGAVELVSGSGRSDGRTAIRDAAETDLMSNASKDAEGFAPVPLAVLPADCAVRLAGSGGFENAVTSGPVEEVGVAGLMASWAFLPDGRVVKLNGDTEWVVAFGDGEAAIGVDSLAGQITLGEKRLLAKTMDETGKPVADEGFAAPKKEDGNFERKPMMESRQTPRSGVDRSRE